MLLASKKERLQLALMLMSRGFSKLFVTLSDIAQDGGAPKSTLRVVAGIWMHTRSGAKRGCLKLARRTPCTETKTNGKKATSVSSRGITTWPVDESFLHIVLKVYSSFHVFTTPGAI